MGINILKTQDRLPNTYHKSKTKDLQPFLPNFEELISKKEKTDDHRFRNPSE